MNALLGVAEWWSRTLWSLSWQIGVLVGVIWLASSAFRRASPNFRYWLWCIVLIRLCFPISLALPAGLSGDVRRAVEASPPMVLLAAQQTVTSPGAPPSAGGSSMPLAVSSPDPEPPSMARVLPGGPPNVSINTKLALGWTAIFLALLLLVLVKHLRVRRMLQRWPDVTRPELLLLVDSLRSRYSIGRTVRMRMFPAAQSSQGPAVVGIWRPTILLPAPVAENWSLDELEPVLLHEIAHVKRLDLLVNLVQMIVQALYFFHPLVWLVNARIRQERELVCDDLAVLHTGGHCKRYSQSFVRVLEETSNDAPFLPVASVGMMERRKPLARRIVRMMSKDYRIHRPLGWLSIALLLIVSAAAITVAADRTADVPSHHEAGPGPIVLPDGKGLQPQHEVESAGRTRPTGKASVSGRVVDTDTGEPITGASLMLLRADTMDGILLVVAGDGSFEFKDIPGGAYRLRVNSALDHVVEKGHGDWILFQLGEEEQKRDIGFTLRRGFSIAGRVIKEEDSDPPPDKSSVVAAWAEGPLRTDHSTPQFRIIGQSTVDQKDGSYRIRGLDGQPVYVQFREWQPEMKDDPYPPVFFPGTHSRDEATKITFDKNGEMDIRNVDILLRKTGGLVLEGTVSSRDTGEPIPKTLVVVYRRDMEFDTVTTYSDAQGHYRFACLGPGKFQLQADATPDGFVRTRKLVTLTDAAPVTRLDLTLMTGATISGAFVQEDGSPWHVDRFKRTAFMQLRGFTDEGGQCNGLWNRYAPGRAEFGSGVYYSGEGDYEQGQMGFPDDTSFIVSGMMPGQAMFNYSPYVDGKRVVRINYEGRDILSEGLKIGPTQVIQGVQIVIGAGDSKPVVQQDATLRSQCTNNLKQMALVFRMFINEEKTETFPALSSEPAQLMFFAEEEAYGQIGVYPEYLTDARVLACPASEEAAKLDTPEVKANLKQLINDRSYVYLGYAVTNDAEVKTFAGAYREHMDKGVPPLEDLPVAEGKGSGGGNTLYRLRGGVERKIAQNANRKVETAEVASQIPVLIERLGHHEKEGGNVLFLDGVVRWISPGVWPMTTATNDALNEMTLLSKR